MTVHSSVFIVSIGFYKLAVWRLRMEPNVANSDNRHCILFLGLWDFWTLFISYIYKDRQTDRQRQSQRDVYTHTHTIFNLITASIPGKCPSGKLQHQNS